VPVLLGKQAALFDIVNIHEVALLPKIIDTVLELKNVPVVVLVTTHWASTLVAWQSTPKKIRVVASQFVSL